MNHTITQLLLYQKQVRLYITDNTNLVQTIIDQDAGHRTAKLALAKLISGMSLIAATLKDQQRLSATFILSNPQEKLFADIDAKGNIRGYTRTVLSAEPATIKDWIGNTASIRMMKGFDMNQFTGITDMPYQNIDDDLSHYFRQSEQIETWIKTDIAIDQHQHILHSYGIYAQLLPHAPKELLSFLQKHVQVILNVCKQMHQWNDLQLEEKLHSYFQSVHVIGKQDVQFHCDCSKQMFYGLLSAMDHEELASYVKNNQSIHSSCHNCGTTYTFTPTEMKAFL